MPKTRGGGGRLQLCGTLFLCGRRCGHAVSLCFLFICASHGLCARLVGGEVGYPSPQKTICRYCSHGFRIILFIMQTRTATTIGEAGRGRCSTLCTSSCENFPGRAVGMYVCRYRRLRLHTSLWIFGRSYRMICGGAKESCRRPSWAAPFGVLQAELAAHFRRLCPSECVLAVNTDQPPIFAFLGRLLVIATSLLGYVALVLLDAYSHRPLFVPSWLWIRGSCLARC